MDFACPRRASPASAGNRYPLSLHLRPFEPTATSAVPPNDWVDLANPRRASPASVGNRFPLSLHLRPSESTARSVVQPSRCMDLVNPRRASPASAGNRFQPSLQPVSITGPFTPQQEYQLYPVLRRTQRAPGEHHRDQLVVVFNSVSISGPFEPTSVLSQGKCWG